MNTTTNEIVTLKHELEQLSSIVNGLLQSDAGFQSKSEVKHLEEQFQSLAKQLDELSKTAVKTAQQTAQQAAAQATHGLEGKIAKHSASAVEPMIDEFIQLEKAFNELKTNQQSDFNRLVVQMEALKGVQLIAAQEAEQTILDWLAQEI